MHVMPLVHEVWAVHVLLGDWRVPAENVVVQFGKHPSDPGKDLVAVVVKQGDKAIPINCGIVPVSKEIFWQQLERWIKHVAQKPANQPEHEERERMLLALYQATNAFKERQSLHHFLRSCGLRLPDIH